MNAMTLYRIGRWSYERGIPIVPKLAYYSIRLFFQSVIPMSVEIGEGTTFGPCLGIVLHERCRIGKNVMIAHQTTIGGRFGHDAVPVIEDNCFIAAGAKVLGPIRIGEGSVVGANAVVINDVPPRTVVAGVPARVIRSDYKLPVIERVEDLGGFEKLKEEWNELLDASSSPCLFLTWEWLWTWWKHLSTGRNLSLLTVRLGGELVAIAPLALRPASVRRQVPFRALEFLGTGSVGSDYLDIIVRRGSEVEAYGALANCLSEDGPMLELTQVHGNGSAVAQLATQLRSRGWRVTDMPAGVCPFIKLSGHSWQSYLATLGAEHRYNFRRKLRALSKLGVVQFELIRSEAERRLAIPNLIDLHHKRWGARGGSDAFHTAELCAFHEEFSRVALERDWLRLFVLKLNGQPAAALYGFCYRNRFYFYQAGFDPQFGTYGVGLVTMGLAIQRACEEGLEEYDLLHGDESYKFHWASQVRELSRHELYPPRLRGSLYEATVRASRAVRRLGRLVVPRPRLLTTRPQGSGK